MRTWASSPTPQVIEGVCHATTRPKRPEHVQGFLKYSLCAQIIALDREHLTQIRERSGQPSPVSDLTPDCYTLLIQFLRTLIAPLSLGNQTKAIQRLSLACPILAFSPESQTHVVLSRRNLVFGLKQC